MFIYMICSNIFYIQFLEESFTMNSQMITSYSKLNILFSSANIAFTYFHLLLQSKIAVQLHKEVFLPSP